jgi:glutamate dehydrogenase (NAD(P)+)
MEATGRGVQFGLQEFFRHPDDIAKARLDGSLAGKKIIIQGLGNVGYHAAKFLREEDGALIIAILERDGAIIDEKGLDVEAVSKYKLEHGKVEGFPGSQFVKNGSDVLEHPCDILLPAAMEGVITHENAPRIKAKVIAEAANGPVTYEADQILNEKGIFIIPDAYLNAGGVTVSYFEWLKNLSHVRFGRMDRRFVEAQGQKIIEAIESGIGKSIAESAKNKLLAGPNEIDLVRSGLDDTMRVAYSEIKEQELSNSKINDRRTAAYALAIRNIADIYESMYL